MSQANENPFTAEESTLLCEALHDLLKIKRKALGDLNESVARLNTVHFLPGDVGIPTIERLLARVEADAY
jgi:hypothetical protein